MVEPILYSIFQLIFASSFSFCHYSTKLERNKSLSVLSQFLGQRTEQRHGNYRSWTPILGLAIFFIELEVTQSLASFATCTRDALEFQRIIRCARNIKSNIYLCTAKRTFTVLGNWNSLLVKCIYSWTHGLFPVLTMKMAVGTCGWGHVECL